MSRTTDIAAVKARVTIEHVIGRKVALKKAGGEYIGLCPFHAEKTPSFTVVPRGPKSEHGFWHCHGACQRGGDVIEFVIKIGLAADIRRAVLYLGGSDLVAMADAEQVERQQRAVVANKEREERAEANRRQGYDMWRTGRSVLETPAAEYLRLTRGIAGDLPSKSALRFHSGLWRREDEGDRPCMMAAMVGPEGTFRALHRTWLGRDTDGRWVKLKPTRMLGPKSGAAIRLYPERFDSIAFPDDGDSTLYIAEGIETALSVLEGLRRRPHMLPLAAVWAAGDLSNMSRLILPSHADGQCFFKNVTLCMDADSDTGGAIACEIHAADHYGARGCKVRAAYPPLGCDMNDVLLDEVKYPPPGQAKDRASYQSVKG